MLHLIWSLICGAIIGWIAGRLMKDEGSWLRNAIVGIVGSGLAGIICNAIGIYSYGFIFGVIANIAGACLLLWIVRKLFK